jgi:hypothetical protein
MKVVDMFGSGLPVCALEYPCIADEMVKHGKNGLLFRDARDLADQLSTLFEGYTEAASCQPGTIDDGKASRDDSNKKKPTKKASKSVDKAHHHSENENLLIRLQANMRERPERKYWHEAWLQHALPVICGRETILHRNRD